MRRCSPAYSIHNCLCWASEITQPTLYQASVSLFRSNQVGLIAICLRHHFPNVLHRQMFVEWEFLQRCRKLMIKDCINLLPAWTSVTWTMRRRRYSVMYTMVAISSLILVSVFCGGMVILKQVVLTSTTGEATCLFSIKSKSSSQLSSMPGINWSWVWSVNILGFFKRSPEAYKDGFGLKTDRDGSKCFIIYTSHEDV